MAKKHHLAISAEVDAVLRDSVITERGVALRGQLSRGLYEAVNAVLLAAGGKWDRRAKMHVFPDDPRVRLGLALECGDIVDTKKQGQQFFTPAPLAEYLAGLAGISAGDSVLEPSAGAGALAVAARERGAAVWCVEQDRALATGLIAAGFLTTVGDFLAVRPADRVDRVVMNHPFAGGQDIAHVEHALSFLQDGGRLVSVMGGGIVASSLKRAGAFRAMLGAVGGRITPLPPSSFSASGTDVQTVVVEVAVTVSNLSVLRRSA